MSGASGAPRPGRGRGTRFMNSGKTSKSAGTINHPKMARGITGKRIPVRKEEEPVDVNPFGVTARSSGQQGASSSPAGDAPSSSKRGDEDEAELTKSVGELGPLSLFATVDVRSSGSGSDHAATAAKKESGAGPMEVEVDIEATRTEEEKVRDHLMSSIFYNDLIFQEIASYLNHGDLQVLSEVSRGFYGLTHSYRPFIDKTTLHLDSNGYNKNVYGSFPWKSVKCRLNELMTKNVTKQAKFCNVIDILKNAEHLHLHPDPPLPPSDECFKHLTMFISSSPKLKSLTLDYTMLHRDISKTLRKPKVISTLRNIESLAFTRCGSGSFTESNNFMDNFKSLIDIPFTLKKFAYAANKHLPVSAHSNIAEFVEKQSESLHELILEGGIFRSVKMKTLICPGLTKLEVTINEDSEDNFTLFLRNQPALVDLSIRHKQGIRKKLLDAIQAKCANLKKLSIRASHFTLDVSPVANQVDPPSDEEDQNWDAPMVEELGSIPLDLDFFRSMSNLVEFSMSQRQSRRFLDDEGTHCVTVEEALNVLPHEQVKVLRLAGMRLIGTYWAWLGTYDENTDTAVAAFSRLPLSLTELHLLDCDATINDRILQFIIANFTLLRVLRFSGCEVTGYGFTGVSRGSKNLSAGRGREEPPGVSLKRLKGLKDLTIVNLGAVSGDSLVASIEFPELIHLDMRPQKHIYGSISVTNDQIIQIVKQNPSLKSLCAISRDPKDLEKRINELSTRIKETRLQLKDSSSMTLCLGASDDLSSEDEGSSSDDEGLPSEDEHYSDEGPSSDDEHYSDEGASFEDEHYSDEGSISGGSFDHHDDEEDYHNYGSNDSDNYGYGFEDDFGYF